MNISCRIRVLELGLDLPGNSLLFNFATMVSIQMSDTLQTLVQESGAPFAQGRSADMIVSVGAAGIATEGLVVGTGITPVDIEDYALAAKVLNGVGAGQLQYGTVTHQAPARVDNSVQWAITRSFTNNSGNSIVIQEIGLLSRPPAVPRFQIFREVIEPVPILNLATRTFSIVFTITA